MRRLTAPARLARLQRAAKRAPQRHTDTRCPALDDADCKPIASARCLGSPALLLPLSSRPLKYRLHVCHLHCSLAHLRRIDDAPFADRPCPLHISADLEYPIGALPRCSKAARCRVVTTQRTWQQFVLTGSDRRRRRGQHHVRTGVCAISWPGFRRRQARHGIAVRRGAKAARAVQVGAVMRHARPHGAPRRLWLDVAPRGRLHTLPA